MHHSELGTSTPTCSIGAAIRKYGRKSLIRTSTLCPAGVTPHTWNRPFASSSMLVTMNTRPCSYSCALLDVSNWLCSAHSCRLADAKVHTSPLRGMASLASGCVPPRLRMGGALSTAASCAGVAGAALAVLFLLRKGSSACFASAILPAGVYRPLCCRWRMPRCTVWLRQRDAVNLLECCLVLSISISDKVATLLPRL